MIFAPILAPLAASLCLTTSCPSTSSTLSTTPVDVAETRSDSREPSERSALSEPIGTYVESRTASVFAGACHYAGELTTAGRDAVLAWSIESGSSSGVDVGGARVVLAVVDDVNLVEAPLARRAIVYVDANETPARVEALVAFVRARVPDLVDSNVSVTRADIAMRVDAESYALRVGERLDLAGDALPDRACCKMPYQVWYEPFARVDHRLVGHDASFRFDEPALQRAWSRPDENSAFFGRFGEGERAASR